MSVHHWILGTLKFTEFIISSTAVLGKSSFLETRQINIVLNIFRRIAQGPTRSIQVTTTRRPTVALSEVEGKPLKEDLYGECN